MDLSDVLAQFDPAQLKPRLQAGTAVGSSMLGQAVGGLNAIPTALTQGSDAAAKKIADVQEAMTYQPSDPKAQALIQQLQGLPAAAGAAYDKYAPAPVKAAGSALGSAWDSASQAHPMLAAGLTGLAQVGLPGGEEEALLKGSTALHPIDKAIVDAHNAARQKARPNDPYVQGWQFHANDGNAAGQARMPAGYVKGWKYDPGDDSLGRLPPQSPRS